MDKPFNIYIGLRKWNPQGENVTTIKNPEDAAAIATRFSSPADPEEISDISQSHLKARIKFLKHALRIFWENETEGAGDYELLPLAQMEFDGNDIILSPTFVPPVISIACSDILTGLVKGIREEVTLRCSVLEEYKHPKLNQSTQDADESNYMVFLLALRALSRYVPLLHHHTAGSPPVHPWTMYGILRSLVGELSVFTDRIDALGRLKDGTELLPAYRHDQLGSCFQEAKILIDELLNGIMIGAENVIHLIREGDYFRALIPVETFDNRNLFYLMLRSTVNSEEWEQTIQHMVKNVFPSLSNGPCRECPWISSLSFPRGYRVVPTPFISGLTAALRSGRKYRSNRMFAFIGAMPRKIRWQRLSSSKSETPS
jgi:type VI secretion system protein ImpJ